MEQSQNSSLREEDNRRPARPGKPYAQLQPDMRADEATRFILRDLFAAMRANEAGIKADSDVECLHAYRVAVRRTRSALRHLRKVFPKGRARHFERAFKAAGRTTNELRDLDIYLLAEAGYRAMLPRDLRKDLAPLFDHLRASRGQALLDVVAYLESETYAQLLGEWQRFLDEPAGESPGSRAATAIDSLARRRISRQFRAVIKMGDSLLGNMDDARLHALRIECKQLRYLLEFFAGLFPAAEIKAKVRQLKRLQDNLGTITDLAVQRAYLLSLAETLELGDDRARRTLVAIGFLIAALERRQAEAKAAFAAVFREYSSPAHRNSFERLFGQE